MVTHNFEESLKFDNNFVIDKNYCISLMNNNGAVRKAIVVVPARGKPRITIKTHITGSLYYLTTYKVVKNELVYVSITAQPHAIKNFDALIPEKNISFY